MKTAFRLLIPAVAFLAAAPFFADPKMPDGFVASWSDSSGLTWRETGAVPLSMAEALTALKAAMKKQGYALRHDITGEAFGERHLFLWVKGREEATIMVWPDGEKSTGISWGVTDPNQITNSVTNTLQRTTTNGKDN